MDENTKNIENCISKDEIKAKIKALFPLVQTLSPVFVALSDSVRQNLFMALLEAGADGMNVGDLTAKTHLSRPAISHHLKVLKDSGLIVPHKSGTQIFYFVKKGIYIEDFRKFHDLFDEVLQNFDFKMIGEKAPWMLS